MNNNNNDTNKKIILVNGDNSKWFKQAIFILNPSHLPPIDVVSEAEKIINNHFLNKYKSNMSKKQTSSLSSPPKKSYEEKFLNLVLNICILLCIVLIGILLYSFSC